MEFINTLENLSVGIIVQSVHDHRGCLEFGEAVLKLNLPNFLHDKIILKNMAVIEDFIFWNYYENGYVHELGIDSDDPEF